MPEYLITLRAISCVIGIGIALWSFLQFRKRVIRRFDFLLFFFIGVGLLIVSIYPDSINMIAGMMALDNRQYGRLIALLLISNIILWLLLIGSRIRAGMQARQFDLLVRSIAMREFLDGDTKRTIHEISVVIPAFNEGDNLEQLLPRIPKKVAGKPLGVLVIDDGSKDNTREVVQRHGYSVASYSINRGGGAALRLGYDIATHLGAKIIVTMDADCQHLPEEIELLVTPILKGDFDIVIGSRILGSFEKANTIRWIGVYVFNFLINLIAGTHITDCSSGFRAFNVDALTNVLLVQDQFHTAELIIDATRKGLRIGEVPITHLKRLSGRSKKGHDLSYGFNFSKVILKTWLRK